MFREIQFWTCRKNQQLTLKVKRREVCSFAAFLFPKLERINVKSDFKPINVESKTGVSMNVHIHGQMSPQGTKEVSQILAKETGLGLKWLLFCVGFAIVCFGISLIKWW